MVRSLWTAAAGMTSQQTNVDTISNNLVKCKYNRIQDGTTHLIPLYQQLQAKTTSANGETKPVNAQVGLGSRVSAVTSQYVQGSVNKTDSDTDFAIVGNGFFGVVGEDGQTYYTRNGNFGFSIATEGYMLCTSEGLPVLSSDGNELVLGPEYDPTKITVDGNGNLLYPSEENNNNPTAIGLKIGLFQFANPAGLDKTGDSLLVETEASGIALNEDIDEVGKKSTLKQGYLVSEA